MVLRAPVFIAYVIFMFIIGFLIKIYTPKNHRKKRGWVRLGKIPKETTASFVKGEFAIRAPDLYDALREEDEG